MWKYYNKNRMKKKFKNKQLFIIGIVSFVSLGIMLSCNKDYFSSNKNIKSINSYDYKINKSNNDTVEYNQEIININFQINVLKSALSKNKNMLDEYNKVYKVNISYKNLQSNYINNKIKIANSTIIKEWIILNNMKKIIINHPFNYLSIFQDKNYKISNIVYKNATNKLYSMNNIKSYNSNIIKSNVSIKTISYQSEEATLGLGSISSILSSSKMLFLSKVHLDYSGIYYYSNFLNNLSTLNGRKLILNEHIKNDNVFLNDKSLKNTKSDKASRETLSILYDGYNIYKFAKKHKVPIIISIVSAPAAFGIGLILYAGYKYEKMLIDNSLKNQDAIENSLNESVQSNIERNILGGADSSSSSSISGSLGKYISNNAEAERFINNLYESKNIKDKLVTIAQFREELMDYGIIAWNPIKPTVTSVETYIQREIEDTENKNQNFDLYNINEKVVHKNNSQSLSGMVDFLDNRQMENNHTYPKTDYGWFKIPTFENIDKSKLTPNQRHFISDQFESFQIFLESIPIMNMTELNPSSEKIISKQILMDLRQLHAKYYSFLHSINGTLPTVQNGKLTQEDEAANAKKLKDFFTEFCKTRMEKKSFDNLGNYGIKREEIPEHMLDKLAHLAEGE